MKASDGMKSSSFWIKELLKMHWVFLLFLSSVSVASESSWTELAQQLGQSTAKRSEAIQKLKKIPELNSVLLQALDSQKRLLSLEVISALRIQSLTPALLRQVRSDQDGFLILTLNSFIHEKNKKEIFEHYLRALRADQLHQNTPAAIAAMLEPVGRLGQVLPRETLIGLMKHSYPEVQASALNYLRRRALFFQRTDQLSLISEFYPKFSFQNRIQAIMLFEELKNRSIQEGISHRLVLVSLCQKDSNSEVRARCHHLD